MYSVVSNVLENWTSFYADHALIRTLIGFFHIGGLVIGGGFAISADRMTLRASRRTPAERVAQLEVLRSTHRIVLFSLAAVAVSGLMLLAADMDAFLHSILFWTKMALIGGLLANGLLITYAEKQAASRSFRSMPHAAPLNP